MSRPFSDGAWTVSTAVMVLPENVTFTWTGPYRVSTAEPVTTRVAAGAAGEAVDGEGVGVVAVDPPEALSVADPLPVVVDPAAAVEWMAVCALVVASPTPYSFRPTVAPMTTRITVKRMVPRQDRLLMTCSVLLGG
jgi:hypothetical protein